jgi:hypothetical protein
MKQSFLVVVIAAAAACKQSDPAAVDAPARADAAVVDAGPDASRPDPTPACPEPTDYEPGATDTWPVCVSDDGAYHAFDANIATIARIGGFEAIAALLFTGGEPTAQDFTDARVQYSVANGLESRLSRREDEHYPPAMKANVAVACNTLDPGDPGDAAILAANADRCVGPVRLQPIVNAAFATGQDAGSTPFARRVAAAKLEGALLWFLYVSVHKEATTCTTTRVDCDSAWAYYSGGEPRTSGKGLSRYVLQLDPVTHDRIWVGELAVRCWRDLDNPTGVAMDLAMRDRAIDQLDRAALRGVAVIVIDKLTTMQAATGEPRAAVWEMIRTLAPVLDREATVRDAAAAATIRGELAKTDATAVQIPALIAAVTQAFPCP